MIHLLRDCLSPTWLYNAAQNLATSLCPAKTQNPRFPTWSMASPTFPGFHNYTYQSLEGADSLAKGKILSKVELAHGGYICQVHTYYLCDGGRPLIVIYRSISIIPSIPADDHCNICMTQSRQLICLLH